MFSCVRQFLLLYDVPYNCCANFQHLHVHVRVRVNSLYTTVLSFNFSDYVPYTAVFKDVRLLTVATKLRQDAVLLALIIFFAIAYFRLYWTTCWSSGWRLS